MDLFAVLDATWPAAARHRLGPWTLRAGAGGGRRVSAITLDGADGDPGPALARARALGERPVMMIRPGQAALDARLASLGLAREAATRLYAGPAAALARAPAELGVIDCALPLAALAEIWAAGGVGPARLAVMARVEGPKRYLMGRLDDRPAAAGFVAIAPSGVAMLHALQVAQGVRRRGLGQRMVQAAAAWAAARGAASLAMAVEAENAAADALARGLGMAAAGGYHYRVAP